MVAEGGGTCGFVVVYVEDGSVTLTQSGRTYRAGKGRFVLVDGTDAYECVADGPAQILGLRYDGLGAAQLYQYITLEGERVIELPNRYFAVECMLVIYDALRSGEPVNEPRASLAITMLLTELADHAKAHGELLRWTGSVAKDRETMDRVITYINGHLDEPLGLRELSAEPTEG